MVEQGSFRRLVRAVFGIATLLPFISQAAPSSPYNGRISYRGSRSVQVSSAATSVALDSEFRRTSDGALPMKFDVVSVQDPSSVLVDAKVNGKNLVIAPAEGKSGSAYVNVIASFANHFPVYDNIKLWTPDGTVPKWSMLGDQSDDVRAAGLEPRILLTHDFFFKCKTENDCDFRQLEVGGDGESEGMFDILDQYVSPDEDVILDIEHEGFLAKAPGGLIRLWEALTVVNQKREQQRRVLGLTKTGSVGYYMVMPGRWWWGPTPYARLQRDRSLNLNSYYVIKAENEEKASGSINSFYADYLAWQANSDRYRFEEPFPGAAPIADGVTAIYPSLYTLYRAKDWKYGAYLEVTYDSNAKQFKTGKCGFQHGNVVQFVPRKAFSEAQPVPSSLLDPKIPPELRPHTDYYVHNPNNDSYFELKAKPGDSTVMQFSRGFEPQQRGSSNFIHMMRTNQGHTLCQDMDVVDWNLYAEEHIKEARKYGKPVYAFLSPTYRAIDGDFVEPEFWRQQLEVVRHLADGIVIFDKSGEHPSARQSRAWWRETLQFMESLYPRLLTLRIDVSAAPARKISLPGDADNDTQLTGEDFLLCMRNPRQKVCDFNGDGNFGQLDQALLLSGLRLPTMLGDINRDGSITAADEVGCRSRQGADISSSNYLCDMNRSRAVNEKDMELLREIYFTKGRTLGDLDSSGSVDSVDVVIAFSNYTGQIAAQKSYAQGDVDGDGDVDGTDIATVMAVVQRSAR